MLEEARKRLSPRPSRRSTALVTPWFQPSDTWNLWLPKAWENNLLLFNSLHHQGTSYCCHCLSSQLQIVLPPQNDLMKSGLRWTGKFSLRMWHLNSHTMQASRKGEQVLCIRNAFSWLCHFYRMLSSTLIVDKLCDRYLFIYVLSIPF